MADLLGKFFSVAAEPSAWPAEYLVLAGSESLLLIMFFLRVKPRATALLLAIVLFVDNLGSFLNHRLLMALEFFMVSLCPVPVSARQDGYRGKGLYWNLDLVRFQLSLVYLVSAVHKLNSEFTSGETLQNLFWMTDHHDMKHYPAWVMRVVLDPEFCRALALSTIAIELMLAFGLNSRRAVGWLLPVAVLMHLAMALLMAYIKIFTVQVLFALVAFLPDRVVDGGPYELFAGSRAVVPRLFSRILWPGYVTVVGDASLSTGWRLRLPTGEERIGYQAWVELLSLSPVTFVAAEVLRAIAGAVACESLRQPAGLSGPLGAQQPAAPAP